jgi:hypothetical protein
MDYCSPLRAGRSASCRSPLPSSQNAQTGRAAYRKRAPICWRFHHDLARRPSDRPIVRGRAILWWFGGRSRSGYGCRQSPSPRRVPRRHCPCRDSAGSPDVVACRTPSFRSSASPLPSSRTHRSSLTPGTHVFRGLLAPGSTPRTNRLGGGRRRGGSLTQMRGRRLARSRRRRRDQLHRDSRARSLSWAEGGGRS